MTPAPTVSGTGGPPTGAVDAITLGSKPTLLRSHQRHIGQLPVGVGDSPPSGRPRPPLRSTNRWARFTSAALGNWTVYYEPRRSSAHLSSSGGRQSYFATARIVRVDADPRRTDHYYAYVEDYLEFDRPVPFRE